MCERTFESARRGSLFSNPVGGPSCAGWFIPLVLEFAPLPALLRGRGQVTPHMVLRGRGQVTPLAKMKLLLARRVAFLQERGGSELCCLLFSLY